ncbi:MAG TPA: ATP-dependent DNA helicase RecG [Candidatus Limnocylindrales bacterium]|nr:ATP-dependent DNA helicase RecG [Candidatus Limnocylindrales bacterium]
MAERRPAPAKAAATKAPKEAPPSGSALLDWPIGKSGLPGASVLGRVGRRMGVERVRDLLFHLPRRYDDLREMRKLGELFMVEDGTVISARVRVADVRVEASFRRRVQRTIAILEDDTGTIQATWFGRRFIERRLHAGDPVIVSGKLKHFGRTRTLDNPDFQPEGNEDELLHVGRIVPVYRLTQGLTAVTLRRAVREALDKAGAFYADYLPARIVSERQLQPLGEALEEAHFPTAFDKRDAALDRLAFDELLALQLGMVARRRERTHERGGAVPVTDADDERIRESIIASLRRKLGDGIDLTADQKTALDAIRADLARPTPMLRLLQGDVGSGKTAVAAWALAAAALAGRQAAILAPTDLLARQHHRTLNDLLEPLGLPIELLTGSLKAADADRVRGRLADGMAPIVVGTHALISESVAFADLALAVIDEQHRFGVDQRAALEAKAGGRVPHVLLMTATPIPRTLGQMLYADLDVTDLRTPPEGRVRIRTGIREPNALESTWAKVREEAAAGHRTFVVVPLITPGDDTETDADSASAIDLAFDLDDGEGEGAIASPASSAVAAVPEAERLRELLAPLRVGLVHGRLKAAERDAEMARFRDGELDVLVGTTVIEVGVDVPEATMMVIEGADRFGLAQLHQLRGRVGRGTAESFCVLVSEATDPTARARLEAARDLRDGFELAERDWELRREGNVLGLVQSGLPSLRIASLQREGHRELATAARAAAETLLDDAGGLRPGNEALARELNGGWLARVAEAEPAGAA